MVRNAASMQNLRGSMSDLNFSSPHPQHQYPPSKPQRNIWGAKAVHPAERTAAINEEELKKSLEDKRFPRATSSNAELYAKPFCDFLTDNPTVFHAVASQKKMLKEMGWTELDERDAWDIQPSGRYYVERNGSSLIAFVVGEKYEPGNGCAILAGHVDALTAKLKPISEVPNKAGYQQLGVAPYAGAMNSTWWDRDLGIAGRVLVKEGDKIVSKLVDLNWPIARIPTLAPHFGEAAMGPFNKETQMVPIIGLEGVDSSANATQSSEPFAQPTLLGGEKGPVSNFINTQPKALVKAVAKQLGLSSSAVGNIINWELELYDVQPATVGGLNKEFIYGGRIDDKLCSWAAMQALMGSQLYDTRFSGVIKVVGWFDDEEIGSQLRQGAKSNFLPQTIERAVGSLSKHSPSSDLFGRTYANSYILSSDVTHAVNPNFLGAYLANHAPHLNTGLVVAADSNGHMTTDSISTAILQRCSERVGAKLQVFQIRNDSRSGGTVGPMLSSMTGIRAIDAGLPQLSMHSIRATTGSLDPGLGVLAFTGFLNGFEHVDKEFRA
ncbi:vacuolar aminopeptidase 1 [Saxophila tyrrhenica]|uniref:Vacuolar aminopeptidase 1 n=1 Tax=Saxophila tyrrhenica TaxID=1690608 RepID=A0AAV9P4V8_9PEZI|nr:vacuolar aminopeptidase 1 [Saxophila tyrrhenica]